MNLNSQVPATKFSVVEVSWPGYYARFRASQASISRILRVLIPEIVEAEREFSEAQKEAKNPNVDPVSDKTKNTK